MLKKVSSVIFNNGSVATRNGCRLGRKFIFPRRVGRETQAVATYGGPVEPYQHEPLAHDTDTDSDNCESSSDHELDIDGLPPAIRWARYEKNIDVKHW